MVGEAARRRLDPLTHQNAGRLTLGGTSPSLYTDSITYGPITSTSHAADYWSVPRRFTRRSALDRVA